MSNKRSDAIHTTIQTVALRVSSTTSLSLVRETMGYDRAIRDLGCAWFFLLAIAPIPTAYTHMERVRIGETPLFDSAKFLSTLSLMFAYLAFSWFILNRPAPVACHKGILPSLTAFLGAYLPWSLAIFLPMTSFDDRSLTPIIITFIGTTAAVVVTCFLGQSFSIVPQARRLVRAGPYIIIRHPLYLAEEVALFGLLLRFFSSVTFAIFIAHGALQIGRILFEENLLRRTFPDYDDYARSTSRVIPYVW